MCMTITSIDSSWEASGHTPYHIDFSLERLPCADGGLEEINRREKMVMVMMVVGPDSCNRFAGIMECSKEPAHEGDVLWNMLMYFNHINAAISYNNCRRKEVWLIFSVVTYQHCWFPVRLPTSLAFAVNWSMID